MMKDLDQAAKIFAKRVRQHEDHVPIITKTKSENSFWRDYNPFHLKCSCGWQLKSWDGKKMVHTTGVNGDILTNEYRAFNNHVISETVTAPARTEPILVGKIHKARVTNEIWLFHRDHDQPPGFDPNRYYDWMVYHKQSNGWKQRGGAKEFNAAQAMAADYLTKQDGVYVVEWMQEGHIGVEAPVSTIITAAAKLVSDAKELKNTPTALRDHLKLVHEGVTQLNILKQLEGELEERLCAFMDLGL